MRPRSPQPTPEELPKWQPSSEVARWFDGLDPSELDIIEHGGRFLYPDTIERKNPKRGAPEGVKVFVRVPNAADLVMARKDAIAWATELLGNRAPARPTVESFRELLGDYWEHLDNICILSHCIFEPEPPHHRYLLPNLLDAHHPRSALYALFARLDWWARQEDPRVGELTENEVLEVAAAIAKRGHTGPLAVIDGHARERCVTTMARLLVSSATDRSSSPSPATSTPG